MSAAEAQQVGLQLWCVARQVEASVATGLTAPRTCQHETERGSMLDMNKQCIQGHSSLRI